jgi:hypothetical protein
MPVDAFKVEVVTFVTDAFVKAIPEAVMAVAFTFEELIDVTTAFVAFNVPVVTLLLIFAVPTTSKLNAGVVVPIPTPTLVILNPCFDPVPVSVSDRCQTKKSRALSVSSAPA